MNDPFFRYMYIGSYRTITLNPANSAVKSPYTTVLEPNWVLRSPAVAGYTDVIESEWV